MENNHGKYRMFGWVLVAIAALIITFGIAYLISGREIIERPLLIFFLLLTWFGFLSGIAVTSQND
jgi:hypothetical protein